MLFEKDCLACGSRFTTRSGNGKYCKKDCFWRVEYERRRTKPNKNKKARELREEWKKRGLCISCACPGVDVGKVVCRKCLDKSKERDLRLKEETFKTYGGVRCSCIGCTITNIKVLELDHIHGKGNEERKTRGSGNQFYQYLRKSGYPEGYRVLCANCNKGRWVNGGECPLHAK
jgi:hypothetical protein